MPLSRFPLPMSLVEARRNFGWDGFDVILISGDAYIDHPAFGAGLIGRWLQHLGLRVGIIAQPDWHAAEAFKELGRPKLFFGVTAGNLDSQLSRLTVMRRPRSEDQYSPNGAIGKRPDLATAVYSQRLREAFKADCPPIIIGGVEASLRRLSYYDYWSEKVKRPVILDAKADMLVFGQGERPLRALAAFLQSQGSNPQSLNNACLPGTSLIRKSIADIEGVVELPPWEEVSELSAAGREQFGRMFRQYYLNCDPAHGRPVAQRHGERYVVIYPPPPPPTTAELDEVYALPFTRHPHPSYGAARIPCYEMIKDSVTTHRGCYGGCAFCAISVQQGPSITSRSKANVLQEVETLAGAPDFCGVITDLGGPTANMYGTRCKQGRYRCAGRGCLFPEICPHLETSHAEALAMLAQARRLPKVKRVFIQSGIRCDLAVSPGGKGYIEEVARHHVCGRLKIAPEHISAEVLRQMRKPALNDQKEFLNRYERACATAGRDQYTVQYFISGHPGCKLEHMVELAQYLKKENLAPEQVQDFYPAPLTLGMALWHCGFNPLANSKEAVYTAKTAREKRLQRALFFFRDPAYWPAVREALRECNREDLIGSSPQCLVP